MTVKDILESVHTVGGVFRVDGGKLILEADSGVIGQGLKEAIRTHKEDIIKALSQLPEKKYFKAASLKEGLTDFIYQDGKPIQLKIKPSGLIYEVAPINEDCQAAGYCRHDLMQGGWCDYYPIFIDRQHIGYCRARIPANSQTPAGSLI